MHGPPDNRCALGPTTTFAGDEIRGPACAKKYRQAWRIAGSRANFEWDLLQAKPDIRRDYGEPRVIGHAPISMRVYCVVYTDRGDERRIISLRKANGREVKRYANQI